MSKMSKRQEEIMDFIKKEVKEKGYPPSVREIGEAVGLASSSTVHGHLARLEQKGLLRRDPTKPRAIEILDTSEQSSGEFQLSSQLVPVIGKVTAGSPITAIEDTSEYFPLPSHLVGDSDVFMLTVSGDSMIEAGILNGDYVIVRRQSNATNGDIVVAMTEDEEATVKRYYREADHIRLQPENSSMKPLRYKHAFILGLVIGVFRYL